MTLTLDNGGEFAGHEHITQETNVDVFFAKPHASWQRGTNENTNGRLRRFWPKKFKMGSLQDEEIDNRVFMLNCTPRKVLGGITPYEVFTGKRVALIA
ncbi:MAG: IS30 family transposase [Endozoicomonadaceae bacterium]|nr:IS30 family transposase [Endozoicomonadaceae bacterium]